MTRRGGLRRLRDVLLLANLASLAALPLQLAAQPRPPDAWTAPYPPADEPGGQPITDAIIQGKLLASYALNPHVGVFGLDVAVERGMVILSGTVDSVVKRELAVEIARGIEEVKDVKPRIKVDPEAQPAGGDEAEPQGDQRREPGEESIRLVTRVEERLRQDPGVDASGIHLNAENGKITLYGKVRSAAMRDLAGQLAINTAGVRSVDNELRIAHQD